MLHINNNTKMNFLLEALPSWQLEANASARIGDIIDAAIEVANKDWPNDWTPEKIGDLTIKEFETFLISLNSALFNVKLEFSKFKNWIFLK